jgi:hypothetical protein
MRRTSTVTAWLAHAEHVRHLVLDFGGMLRRAVDRDVFVFAGHRECGLAFEIEMLLTADGDASLDDVRRRGDRSIYVTAFHRVRRLQVRARGHRVGNGEKCRQFLVVDARQLRRGSGSLQRLGRHGEQRLAPVLHEPVGEHRVVAHHGADVVDARNVGRGENGDHPRRGANGGEVHGRDARMRPCALRDVDMQRAGRLGNVVRIGRRARDVLHRAVVAQRLGDAAVDLLFR